MPKQTCQKLDSKILKTSRVLSTSWWLKGLDSRAFQFWFFFPNLEFLNGNSIAFQIISNCVDRSDPLENYKKNLDGPQVLQSQQNHIFESFAAHPWSYKLALAGNNSFSPSRWLGFFRDTSRTLSQNKNQGTP